MLLVTEGTEVTERTEARREPWTIRVVHRLFDGGRGAVRAG